MKTVIKNKNNGTWCNIINIQAETDWNVLTVWLSIKQIEELKQKGHILVDEYYYYVTSDKETLDFEQSIAPLLRK